MFSDTDLRELRTRLSASRGCSASDTDLRELSTARLSAPRGCSALSGASCGSRGFASLQTLVAASPATSSGAVPPSPAAAAGAVNPDRPLAVHRQTGPQASTHSSTATVRPLSTVHSPPSTQRTGRACRMRACRPPVDGCPLSVGRRAAPVPHCRRRRRRRPVPAAAAAAAADGEVRWRPAPVRLVAGCRRPRPGSAELTGICRRRIATERGAFLEEFDPHSAARPEWE